LQCARKGAAARRRRGADVAADRQAHADESCEPGQEGPRDECERAITPRLEERQRFVTCRLFDRGRREEHDHRDRNEDHQDRAELAFEVRHRTLLDRFRDVLHRLGALILGEHAAHQEEPDRDCEQRGQRRRDEDGPLTSTECEGLVTAFGGEYVRHLLPLGLSRLLDVHLIGDGGTERSVLAVDPQYERSVERMLFLHLHSHAGS
jgi:hypothetical protein